MQDAKPELPTPWKTSGQCNKHVTKNIIHTQPQKKTANSLANCIAIAESWHPHAHLWINYHTWQMWKLLWIRVHTYFCKPLLQAIQHSTNRDTRPLTASLISSAWGARPSKWPADTHRHVGDTLGWTLKYCNAPRQWRCTRGSRLLPWFASWCCGALGFDHTCCQCLVRISNQILLAHLPRLSSRDWSHQSLDLKVLVVGQLDLDVLAVGQLDLDALEGFAIGQPDLEVLDV